MLTVMCPNCRHRFPAPGCCNPGPQGRLVADNENKTDTAENIETMRNNDSFYGGGYLLVPREFNDNNRSCFINAPTIIHGPTIIQQPSLFDKTSNQSASRDDEIGIKSLNHQQQQDYSSGVDAMFDIKIDDSKEQRSNDFTDCHVETTCELTGGTVTITTPNIQSGGCLIRSRDSEIFIRSPKIEIRPKLSGGGGCYVQKQLTIDATNNDRSIYRENHMNETNRWAKEKSCTIAPSGCQELPGIRRFASLDRSNIYDNHEYIDWIAKSSDTDFNCRNIVNTLNPRETDYRRDSNDPHEARSNSNNEAANEINQRHSICCCARKTIRDSTPLLKNIETNSGCGLSSTIHRSEYNDNGEKIISNDSNGSMEIRVNATVQLPPNVGHCTVNITATTGNSNNTDNGSLRTCRRDNFNGGGLIHFDNTTNNGANETEASTIITTATTTTTTTTTTTPNNDRRDDAPTTPLSWLMPCSWGFENYPMDKDVTKLTEIKRLFHIGGWYHEGLSWQQSETLLKNTPVGRWLMRDSSDSRYIFAVSVQTPRGPTSIRVHYFFGTFRLDAEPRVALAMPFFECPIKMLQHYVDYSKRIDEHREEVWVDNNGQLYSQIYLTKPLVKEVQTLSHLARLVVNANKLSTDHLPPLIKNYLAEYPYSL